MNSHYTEMQLDALRELANIASGTAATALSQMLGREIELSVPRALALPLADAVDAAGDPSAIGQRRRARARRRHRRARAAPDPDRRTAQRCAGCSASNRAASSATPRCARSATSSAPPT